MTELYNQTIQNGEPIFHRNYCLYVHGKMIAYDSGAIRLISLEMIYDPDTYSSHTIVTVHFENGNISEWSTKRIDTYTLQFGPAVSFDGKYIFAQTWENGLFCFDSHTGEQIWRTKSKRGITSVFVNESTLLCHQHERALQLIDIHAGEVLEEKRPATAWGFTAIDHKHIVCQVTARRWEIIDAETLETKAAFSHRDFTDGHTDYCVNYIKLDKNILTVRGFTNVWDHSQTPPKRLPNPVFEHHLEVQL